MAAPWPPEEFTETVAAPGGFITSVVKAAPAEEHESKRGEVIFQEETKLTSKMNKLRQQTLEKNREFKRQTDALEARRTRLEARMAQEVEERATNFDEMRAALDATLSAFDEDFDARSAALFAGLQRKGADPIVERMGGIRRRMDRYFEEEIPTAMEAQSGAATRQMLKSRESFEIDNKKLRAREAQLIARFNSHAKGTADRFAAEESDRITAFTALGEELDASISGDNREEERVQIDTVNTIASLHKVAKDESEARAHEDAEILDNISGAMEKLQHQILVNFGAIDEEEEGDEAGAGGAGEDG